MNKKLTITLIIGLVIVAAAAFVGGRLLNENIGPMGMIPFGPGGGGMSFAINMTPAPELPARPADLTGIFTERKDNTLTVQSIPMSGEGGGVVVAVSGSSDGGEGPVTTSSGDMGNGPKTEVVVTGKTIIYRDSTAMGEPPKDSNQTISVQQTVETGTLDDIHSNTMLMVWGRKVGDRLIADIVMYSNPIMIQK